MSITDEVRRLAKETGGSLDAAHMIEVAKDRTQWPKLHDHLWAPKLEDLAAEARLSRATRLIIRIEVTQDDGPSVRQFIHIRGMSGYQTVDKVIAQPDLAAIKLAQWQEDIARMRSRYGALAALMPGKVKAIDTHLARAQRAATPPGRQRRGKAA